MEMKTLICVLLAAAASGASLEEGTNQPLALHPVSFVIDPLPPLPSTTEALLSSSTVGTSRFKTKDLTVRSTTQDAAPHVLVEDTADTSIATATNPDTDKSLTAAEPDASLEIAFLVLGVLLALASVVVAVFFGYKQLKFMRTQSTIGRNDEHDSGSGVDLEMGPVDGVGAATDLASSPPSSA